MIWVIGTLVAARVVQCVIYGALAIRLLPDLLKRRRIDLRILRPLLRIGAWITVTNTLWPLTVFLDRFMVGATLSLAAVSYFSTPVDLVSRLGIVPGAVGTALFPAIAASYRSSPDRMQRLLRTGSLAVIVVVLPACLLMAGLSRELLTLWLGESFASNSSQILSILAIGIFFYSVGALPGNVTDAIGRPEAGAIIMLSTTTLFIPIVMLMCTRYGVTGAALAWTFRSILYFAPRLLVCGRLAPGVTPVISRLFAISLVSSAGLTACALIGPLPARLTVIALTFALAMPMTLLMLLNSEELTRIWETIKRFFSGPPVARSLRRT